MSKLRSDELVNMEGDGAPSFPQGATTIEPTTDDQVATKSYVDTAISAASGNAVSDTAPTNPAIGSLWTDTSVSPRALKTWNGSNWIEFSGTAAAAVGVVVSDPLIVATNSSYAPSTLTASSPTVSNATFFNRKWYKDDVEIPGATDLTYYATQPGDYKYEERWADEAGNILTPSYTQTVLELALAAPTINSPIDGSGWDSYYPESSTSTSISTVQGGGLGVPAHLSEWWSVTYGTPSSGTYSGQGLFVAVASSYGPYSKIMYSTNGINWTAANAPQNNNWNSICFGYDNYGNGQFVAVAGNGSQHIMYSTDGINWSGSSKDGANYKAITWGQPSNGDFAGQGLYVGLAYNYSWGLMYSTTGSSWTASNNNSNGAFHDIAYGNGTYVAVGNSVLRYSLDGTSLQDVSGDATSLSWNGVTYGTPSTGPNAGSALFVAVSSGGSHRVGYSLNGSVWNLTLPHDTAPSIGFNSVAYGNGMFVALSNGDRNFWYSTDAINWSPTPYAEDKQLIDMTYGDGKFVAVGNHGNSRVQYSLSGSNWGSDKTILTLSNNKVFDSADSSEISNTTIGEIFTAGTTVQGDGQTSPTGVLDSDADSSTSTIVLKDVTGTWQSGMKLVGDTPINIAATDPTNATFTSSEPVVTTGIVNSWTNANAEWQLAHDSLFAGAVQTKGLSITETGNQTGPDDFVLDGGTDYYVRVKYGTSDPEDTTAEWSDTTHFKTSPKTAVISSAPSSVNEGSSATIQVTTTNAVNGSKIYWDVTNSNDFTTSTGDATVNSNSATFTVTPTADATLEGPESFNVNVYSDPARTDLMVTSSSITINDTSDGSGQVAFTTPGTYQWTAPNNITSVCAVCVGGGGGGRYYSNGGGGGGLGWKNNIPVTPGQSYTVVVGEGGKSANGLQGGDSYFVSTSTVRGMGGLPGTSTGASVAGTGGAGGQFVGDGGGRGGQGGDGIGWVGNDQTYNSSGGGGGAGGYSGTGGKAADEYRYGSNGGWAGSGGGGGGGASGYSSNGSTDSAPGGGGGVGIYGEGPSGAGGSGGYDPSGSTSNSQYSAGKGGSGGGDGTKGGGTIIGYGGEFGGGGVGGDLNGDAAGGGAVRIIWGVNRAFPSTNTQDMGV